MPAFSPDFSTSSVIQRLGLEAVTHLDREIDRLIELLGRVVWWDVPL